MTHQKHWGTPRRRHISELVTLRKRQHCIHLLGMDANSNTCTPPLSFLNVVLTLLQTLVSLLFFVYYIFYYLRIKKKNIDNYMGCLVLHNLTYTQWEKEWQCFRHHHSLFVTPPTPNPTARMQFPLHKGQKSRETACKEHEKHSQ